MQKKDHYYSFKEQYCSYINSWLRMNEWIGYLRMRGSNMNYLITHPMVQGESEAVPSKGSRLVLWFPFLTLVDSSSLTCHPQRRLQREAAIRRLLKD